MPDQLATEPTLREIGEALGRLDERLKQVRAELKTNNRLRNLALAAAVLCLIAAGFSAGYAVHSREQANDANTALREQLHVNRVFSCDQARSVSLAFREPQISSDGTAEPQDHFIERMLAQRVQLAGVANLRCGALPGFATFPYLRAHALHEIEVVLHEAAPRRFPPPKARPVPSLPRGTSSTEEPTEAAPAKVTPGPSHHAAQHPVSTPTEGGGSPPSGNPGHGHTPPAKGSPPVPEPTHPVTAPTESGGSTTTERETSTSSESSQTQAPSPPLLESVGELLESAGEALGKALGGLSPEGGSGNP